MFGEQFNLFRKAEKMTRTIDYNLANTIAEGVRIGYLMALSDFGKHKRLISERQVIKVYGRPLVEEWCKYDLVRRKKLSDAPNGKIFYDDIEVKIAAKATIEGIPKKRSKSNYNKIQKNIKQ